MGRMVIVAFIALLAFARCSTVASHWRAVTADQGGDAGDDSGDDDDDDADWPSLAV